MVGLLKAPDGEDVEEGIHRRGTVQPAPNGSQKANLIEFSKKGEKNHGRLTSATLENDSETISCHSHLSVARDKWFDLFAVLFINTVYCIQYNWT